VPEREVIHSPPPNAEVKNEWSSTFTTPIRLHGVDRDNFNFSIFAMMSQLPLLVLVTFFQKINNLKAHIYI
jgi:hypothetical protein